MHKKTSKLSPKDRYYPLYPDFPASGFMLFLFMLLEGKTYGLLHLSSVYPDMPFVREALPPTVRFFVKRGKKDGITIADEGLLFPLQLLRIVDLPKRAKTPTIDCRNYRFAMQAFLPVAENPTAFEVLVLAEEYYPNEGWLYSSAMPFSKPVDPELVDTFMSQSNYPICPKAKKAAMYEIGPAVCYEWKTGRMRELEAPEAVEGVPIQ